MKRWIVFGLLLGILGFLSGCAAAEHIDDVIHTATTISRAVPKKISFKIPANMLNAVSGEISPTTAASTNTAGPAYQFLKDYVTIANDAAQHVDAVISNVNANTNYLFQTNIIGHQFTNSAGTEWYYFNTNAGANYVYIGDVTSSNINTNFYMDWSGTDDQFTGKAIFYANDATADIQEGTLIFDYSKANPTLDIYIKFKSYFTNFRVLLTSLGDGKLTLQARIVGDHPTNTISSDSWIDTWDIVGYGQTNAPGAGKAWVSGTYTNEYIQTNWKTTNTNALGGLEIKITYTNIQTTSVYNYEEFFSTDGITEWKMGSAQIGGIFHYSIGDFITNVGYFYTNVLNGGHEAWDGTYNGTNYTYFTNYAINYIITNYDDTWPVVAVGADVTITENMDGSTNVITNQILYANTNAKPSTDVSTNLDVLQKLKTAAYPNNTLYPM